MLGCRSVDMISLRVQRKMRNGNSPEMLLEMSDVGDSRSSPGRCTRHDVTLQCVHQLISVVDMPEDGAWRWRLGRCTMRF